MFNICKTRILFFFFNDTATTEIYTLSLHDALPISEDEGAHPLDVLLSPMRSTSVAVGRVLGLLSLFLAVSVVAGALVAGLLVPAVAASGGATRGSIDWFNTISTNLPDTRLQQTSQLL